METLIFILYFILIDLHLNSHAGLVATELNSTGLEWDHINCFIGGCNPRTTKSNGKKKGRRGLKHNVVND